MRTIKGTLGNTVNVKSYVANLAGHISNQVRLNVTTIDGDKVQVKLDKADALELLEELNKETLNLI
ncbi:MAG: hypothetical protein GY823_09495 [Flavobacteriaceae bacterium]|jgi:translation initiation factor IF-1|nr:hypothetical protein [Flavobacteriaceae bacterium]